MDQRDNDDTRDPIIGASPTWYTAERHHLVRIHVPTNGKVTDVQISVDGKMIDLGKSASFNDARNDVYIPLPKTYSTPDLSGVEAGLARLKAKLLGDEAEGSLLENIWEELQDVNNELVDLRATRVAGEESRLTRFSKLYARQQMGWWFQTFWLTLVMVGSVIGYHYFHQYLP